MSKGISILDELRRHRGFDAALVASYNVYFPFFEEVVFRRLIAAGCRHTVLLMDAKQFSASLSQEETRPRLAGKSYSLFPIKAGGAFHPKLILLVSKKKGLLFVGSHNLTLSGLSINQELTNFAEITPDKSGDAKAVWRFVRAWTKQLPQQLQESITSFESLASWLVSSKKVEPSVILGASPEGDPPWSELKSQLRKPIKRITVIGPFFDSKLAFLDTLSRELSPKELIVALDPASSKISVQEAKAFSRARFVAAPVLYRDTYLHAKAILFEEENGRALLVTGSANPSKAAWLEPPLNRNAELLCVQSYEPGSLPDVAQSIQRLHLEPTISDVVWAQVTKTPQDDEVVVGSSFYIAQETAKGFFLEKAPACQKVRILSYDGAVSEWIQISHTEGENLSLEIESPGLRANANLIELEGKQRAFALVHHTQELSAKAESDAHRAFRKAMVSLSGDVPEIEHLLKIVEKMIFDEKRVPISAASHAPSAAESDEPTMLPNSFAVSLQDVNRGKKHARYLAKDDITLVLDFINQQLGQGLERSRAIVSRTEEQLVGTEDDEPAPATPVVMDGAALARACRRKCKSLINRLSGQLAQITNESALNAIRQTAVVLGLIEHLCKVTRNANWVPADEPLVDGWDLGDLFILVGERIYPRATGAIFFAKELLGDDRFEEILMIHRLMLWLGWYCGVDIRAAARIEEKDDLEVNLYELRTLYGVLLSLPSSEVEKARDFLFSWSVGQESVTAQWMHLHMQWAKRLEAIEKDPQRLLIARQPEIGDLVCIPTTPPTVGFVLLTEDNIKVQVIELDPGSEPKKLMMKMAKVIPAAKPAEKRTAIRP